MTTIRVKPEELEIVAKHVPDAEDACCRARTSLSWTLPSLAMEIPGISTAAIDSFKDELLHWLQRYEEKLNEAEELLYRTAAAMRQADQTLADNMKEFGLELLGWYDLQRLFGEYDPITGERISGWDRLVAGGVLLASFIPPVKGAGIAGKAGIKGAKAAGTAADVSKWISKTKNVLHYDKIKSFFQTIYHQVVKGPITETIRSFRKQWKNFLKNVGSVLQGPQPALAGIGPTRGVWISGAEKEVKETTMNIIGKTGDEVVGKGTGKPPVPTKPNGGMDEGDFVNEHSKKHMYDPTKLSTPKKTQYGKDVDVKKLREDTMSNPDRAYSNWPGNPNNPNKQRITKYEKEYGGNISTSDTPTGHHRVFENLDNPSKSTHFPYVPRQ
ncbi:pre-toxin TG domain-containing protein [Parageobacillus sp. KH3-4]|uniref:pre-toxin TG domain-containing protein n=1 Tax=Parageobacillus sp. KH3-4 TaxID=2916802 RepID=UPI001FCC83FE|nr:pre-toxin TG domain-containing protein [Parageobacillus sp. KH3-4]BDG48942.1 hypothetical protein PspKH34_35030 [Parageobacillus sp. KH3-4]